MEKDAAGYPQGHMKPGTSRTSPAAYPTSRTVLRGRGSSDASPLPDYSQAELSRKRLNSGKFGTGVGERPPRRNHQSSRAFRTDGGS